MIRPMTCPICKKPVVVPAVNDAPWFPFCSERCRQVDLLRWCQGAYAIVEPLDPDELDEPTGADPDSEETADG
jgi:uncharacterized protein